MEIIKTQNRDAGAANTEGEVAIGRFVLPYRVYGDGAEYIVCVNGAQQTIASWRTFITYFSKYYRVVAFDLPGQGRAKILSGPLRIHIDEQVEAVRAVCRAAVPHESFYLTGISWGGIVALTYAARYPETVDKLLLASVALRPNEYMMKLIETSQKLYDDGFAPQVGILINETFGSRLPEAFKRKIAHQFETMTEEQCLCFYAHSDFVYRMNDIRDFVDLGQIKADTLMVNGGEDPVLNVWDIVATASLIPRCRLNMMPGIGHFVHFESEAVFGIYHQFFATPAFLNNPA